MRAQKPREESDESEWSGQKRDRDRANRKKTRKIPSYDRTETFGVCPFGDDPNGRDARGRNYGESAGSMCGTVPATGILYLYDDP